MGREGSASVKCVFVAVACLSLIIQHVEGRVLTSSSVGAAAGPDRDPREASYNQLDAKSKRPFCNAFTGCGKKRSNEVAPPPMMEDDGDQRTISELVDFNSEPAIENVMRQILSEAKMYEALQEANREMYMQKQRHNGYGGYSPQRYGYPTTFSTQ